MAINPFRAKQCVFFKYVGASKEGNLYRPVIEDKEGEWITLKNEIYNKNEIIQASSYSNVEWGPNWETRMLEDEVYLKREGHFIYNQKVLFWCPEQGLVWRSIKPPYQSIADIKKQCRQQGLNERLKKENAARKTAKHKAASIIATTPQPNNMVLASRSRGAKKGSRSIKSLDQILAEAKARQKQREQS